MYISYLPSVQFHVVYKVINTTNNKYYIGVHRTFSPHKDPYLGSGYLLIRALKKYGRESFFKLTINLFYTREDALKLEKLLVTEKEVKDPNCYNLTLGGGAPPIHYGTEGANQSLESKQKTRDKKLANLRSSYRVQEYCYVFKSGTLKFEGHFVDCSKYLEGVKGSRLKLSYVEDKLHCGKSWVTGKLIDYSIQSSLGYKKPFGSRGAISVKRSRILRYYDKFPITFREICLSDKLGKSTFKGTLGELKLYLETLGIDMKIQRLIERYKSGKIWVTGNLKGYTIK